MFVCIYVYMFIHIYKCIYAFLRNQEHLLLCFHLISDRLLTRQRIAFVCDVSATAVDSRMTRNHATQSVVRWVAVGVVVGSCNQYTQLVGYKR